MKTYEILQMTRADYDLKVFGLFLEWCDRYSYSDEQLQKLLTNNAIYNWFQVSLKPLEAEFKEDAQPYVEVMTANDALKLYKKHVHKLNLYYSSPLIKSALHEPR